MSDYNFVTSDNWQILRALSVKLQGSTSAVSHCAPLLKLPPQRRVATWDVIFKVPHVHVTTATSARLVSGQVIVIVKLSSPETDRIGVMFV